MKKAITTLGLICLAVTAFCQSLVSASYKIQLMPTVSKDTSFGYQKNWATAFVQHTTFSNVYIPPNFLEYRSPRETVLTNTLWGGITGAAFGASLVLADNSPAYRPKAHDVFIFSTVGAATGLTVGLITGLIRAAK